MNNYLIPANSKRGNLILGFFLPRDLIILGIGIGITLILLLIYSVENITATAIILIPSFISAFLVLPIPHYHNVNTVIMEFLLYITSRRKFIWKGWCVLDGEDEK